MRLSRLDEGSLPPLRRPHAGRTSLPAHRPRANGLAAGRRNQEFLPAHLEILVKPTTPYAPVFIWVVLAMVAAAVGWGFIAKLDIYAVATGRVEPDGRSKVVQPFETSRVRAVLTRNGAEVKAGQVLLELDATQAQAETDGAATMLRALDAQIARRTAVIAAIRTLNTMPDAQATGELALDVETQERAAMRADLARFEKAAASLRAQIDEKTASESRLHASVDARTRLMTALKERQTMRQVLVQQDAGTKASLIDATQQVEQASADLAYDSGQLLEVSAAKRSLEHKIEELQSQTISDQTQLLAEAHEKRAAAVESLTKARFRLAQATLAAPIDGTVQQLAVTTLGQVVTAGQPLLVVVPLGASVEIAAMVPSRDIGFVTRGQAATVKVDAFPFTQYGTLEGRVEQVSRDAVDSSDAGGSADPLAGVRARGVAETAGSPVMQNLMFPVTVKLDKTSVRADLKEIPLTAGMTATVEIRTGSRRVIDYLFSPLIDVVSSSGHER